MSPLRDSGLLPYVLGSSINPSINLRGEVDRVSPADSRLLTEPVLIEVDLL